MTMGEQDRPQKDLGELIRGISKIGLRYYYGEMLGVSFISLDGEDIGVVREIHDRFGDEGISTFSEALGQKLEEDTQKKVDRLERDYREMQKRVHGAPFSPNEPEYIRLKLEGVPGLVTTEDYAGFERPIAAFRGFLGAYRRGEPVEVYLGAKPQEITGVYGNKGIFPEQGAKTIVLQKPQPANQG
jgi:hypothetical protein